MANNKKSISLAEYINYREEIHQHNIKFDKMQSEKFKGIDSRTIDCGCGKENCIIGLSFDTNDDNTHTMFLHYPEKMGDGSIDQRSKGMVLTKDNVKQLISDLKQLKFK